MNPLLDPDRFARVVEAHRAELLRHCYRMLGALGDAEDQVQETFARAWEHRAGFAGRASVRTWLFRIATNGCLNAIEHRARRTLPEHRQPACAIGEPIAERVEEPIWLEPFPGGCSADELVSPAERREHIGLAFVAVLQQLPARQRAVLLLREVLGWEASEVAALLETTVGAVESALHRARTTLAELEPEALRPPVHGDDGALLSRYVSAWERGDMRGFVELLRDDAVFSMPPVPSWFRGRDAIRSFLESDPRFVRIARDGFRLRPAIANGGPAFGIYKGAAHGGFRPHGVMAVSLEGGIIARVTSFLVPALFPRFNLPLVL